MSTDCTLNVDVALEEEPINVDVQLALYNTEAKEFVLLEGGATPYETDLISAYPDGVVSVSIITSAYRASRNWLGGTVSCNIITDKRFTGIGASHHHIQYCIIVGTSRGETYFRTPTSNGGAWNPWRKRVDEFDGLTTLQDTHSTGSVTHSSAQDLLDPQSSVNLEIGDSRFAKNHLCKKFSKDDFEVLGGTNSNFTYGPDGASVRANTVGQGVSLRLSNYFGCFIGTGAGTNLSIVDTTLGFTVKRRPIKNTAIIVSIGLDNNYTTGFIDATTKGIQVCMRVNDSNTQQSKILQSDGVALTDTGWIDTPGIFSLIEQNRFECVSKKGGSLTLKRFSADGNLATDIITATRISAYNVNPGSNERRAFLNLHSENSTTNYYIRFDNIYTIETK